MMPLFKMSGLFLFVLMSLLACEPEGVDETGDPKNLTIEIEVLEDGSGKVTVQAAALNTVTYQFYIGVSEVPEEENVSGSFEFTFTRSGTYTIEIRAYGESGRYIKELREVAVQVGKEVSVNDGFMSPLEYAGYNLIWQDEFEGSSVSSTNWKFELGNGCPNCGWGNNELQYYRRENTSVSEGVLTIEARKENYQGSLYTSSRLVTKGLHSFQYGRMDIRALLPQGQGLWPAIWMLGDSFDSTGWPECGEIDIMEMVGGQGKENTVHGTIHWGDSGNHASTGNSYQLNSGTFGDEYHVFSIIWDQSVLIWLVNDQEYYRVSLSPSGMSEFHEKFFFILNVAVGGDWPGSPDATTVFPQKMKVDYVRVFQKQN